MNKLFFILMLMAFSFVTMNAKTPYLSEDVQSMVKNKQETVHVFVHITALKANKDGRKMAKITNVTLAKKGQKPGKNMVRAKLRRKGNRLQFEIQMAKIKADGFLMPRGFILNDRISKLLGSSQKVVMSGGSTMLKKTETNLLHFEIQ